MAARVTIQDIADELGISRNTVSKAINNTGVLAASTRERIIKKAIEMGYKQFSYLSDSENVALLPKEVTEVALITTTFPDSGHFAFTMLDRFQKELSQSGYCLTVYRLLPHEQKALQLPSALDPARVAGIVCIEMFDYEYCKMLCDLELPTLLIDGPALQDKNALKADQLYMNNAQYSYPFVEEMLRRGKSEIGFIGDYKHCQSFFERYMGYRNACFLAGLPDMPQYCLLDSGLDSESSLYLDFRDYLRTELKKMKKLPQVFMCANDFIALDTRDTLREMGLRVPEDIWLCGFDDSPQSQWSNPPLTTVHIHTQTMGYSAANLLVSRMRQPSLNYRITYTETDTVFRASTGDEK